MGRNNKDFDAGVEFSVVSATPHTAQPPGPKVRHGVYGTMAEAKAHISGLQPNPKGASPNLKVITQPKGTAAKDLKKGRIKMLPGATLHGKKH
jgi:hypothetical protein